MFQVPGRGQNLCIKLSHCANPRYVCSEDTLRTVVGAVGELLLDKRISIEDVRTMPEKKEHKKVDPEAALKASVARDIKLRLMDDAIRQQRLHLSYAVWNNQLGEKDLRAEKKRSEEGFNEDSQLTNQNVKKIRKQKLEALYYEDELKYEDELAMKGLAYRRIRD